MKKYLFALVLMSCFGAQANDLSITGDSVVVTAQVVGESAQALYGLLTKAEEQAVSDTRTVRRGVNIACSKDVWALDTVGLQPPLVLYSCEFVVSSRGRIEPIIPRYPNPAITVGN